jgi:hypothetical protein
LVLKNEYSYAVVINYKEIKKVDPNLHHMKARTKVPRTCTGLWRWRRWRQRIGEIARGRLKLFVTHGPAAATRTPNDVVHHRRRRQQSVRRYRTGPCAACARWRRREACAVMAGHRRRKQERVGRQQQVRRGWRGSGRRGEDWKIVGKAGVDERRRAGRVVDEEYLTVKQKQDETQYTNGYCKNCKTNCHVKTKTALYINCNN